MTLETILLIFMSSLGAAWVMSKRWFKIQHDEKKRQLVLKAELERTENEIRERSLADNIDRANKQLNDGEEKP